MTVLSAQSIRSLCHADEHNNRLISNMPNLFKYESEQLITPYVERGVFGGRSYGLSSAGYDIRIDKIDTPYARRGEGENWEDWTYRMQPGDFLLASSMERIKMPQNLICIVHDKSSWAREGLAIQNTVLEPGWEGYITLELSFHRPNKTLLLRRGDPIAQLIFHKLDSHTEQPYKGKYQNQENRPVEARLEATSEGENNARQD